MSDTATEQPPRVSGRLPLKRLPADPLRSKGVIDTEKIEESLLSDGWNLAAGDVAGKRGGISGENFRKIADLRNEILEDAVRDSIDSEDALGSRISSEVLRKLSDFRGDVRAERIREIISDPGKNSKQILDALNAMKNEGSSVPEPVVSERSESVSDAKIIADVISRIDAAKADSASEAGKKESAKDRPGKVPLVEVKEYLSELVLKHFLQGMREGRFDRDGVPHLSLDTLVFNDGRPLLDVIASKDRRTVAKLLKDTEAELGGLNESELVRRMDIFNGITSSFLKIEKSIGELGRVTDPDELEAMPFPVPMREMRELGFDELPEHRKAVLVKKQKSGLERWRKAKDEARKRLGVTGLTKRRGKAGKDDGATTIEAGPAISDGQDPIEAISAVASDSKTVSETDSGAPLDVDPTTEAQDRPGSPELSFDEAKRIVADELKRKLDGVLDEVDAAGKAGDIATLKSIKKSDRWRLFDPKKVGIAGLPDDRMREIVGMLVEGSRESGHLVKGKIDEWIGKIETRPDAGEKLLEGELAGKGSIDAMMADARDHTGSDEEATGNESVPENPAEDESSLPGVKEAYEDSIAAAHRYNEGVKESIGKVPEIAHLRRGSERSDSVARADALDAANAGAGRKIELESRIAELKTLVSEKASSVADLESGMIGQRADLERKAELRKGYEKRFEGVFSKYFVKEDMLKQFNREEENARKALQDMESALKRSSAELDRLRAELSEAEHDLEQFAGSSTAVSKPEEAADAELRRMADESFGPGNYTIEGSPNDIFEGVDDAAKDSAVGVGDPVFEAAATGIGIKDIPAEHTVGMDSWSGKKTENTASEGEPAKRQAERVVVPSEKSVIDSGVEKRFVGEFGIERSDLESIDGFGNLSAGQQMLVLENLKQLAVGRIAEEAEGKVAKEMRDSGFLGRVWKAVSKKYQIAKAEKSTAEEIFHGGIGMHEKVLRQLVNGMRSMGPEAEIGADGKTVEIRFSRSAGKVSESNKSVADEFDRVANEFARMPYEWSLSTASDDERERYAVAQDRFRESFKEFGNSVYAASGSLPEAHLVLNDIDGKMRMMQFLQTSPELENRLLDIKDKSAWRVALNGVFAERGAYMAYGYVGRTLSAGLLGWAAAPVVAAGAGGFMSWKRAKETLVSQDIAARRGEKGAGAEAKNVVTAQALSEKLEKLIFKLEDVPGTKGRADAALSLKTRMEYTRRKVEEGLVDFGAKAENRVWEQYDLLQLLSRAEAVVGIYSGENKELNDRLGKFLDFKERKITVARKKYIRNQVLKGMAISGGFALAGAAVRHLSDIVSDRIAVPPGPKETLDDVLGKPGQAGASEPKIPIIDTPVEDAPDSTGPTRKNPDDWDASATGEDGLRNASYEQPTEPSRTPDLSRSDDVIPVVKPVQEAVPSEPIKESPVRSGTGGVEAESVHGRTDSSLAYIGEATKAEIARQEALELEELRNESSPVVASAPPNSEIADAGVSSNQVSRAWNESVESAKLGTTDDRFSIGDKVRPELSLDSQDSGMASPPSSEPVPAVSEGTSADSGITYRTEQVKSAEEVAKEYLADGTDNPDGSASRPAAVETPAPDEKAVREMVRSGEVQEYLLTHPEKVDSFRRSLADYDTSIFEVARGESDARGVGNLSELNDAVKAKQVMYDCLKLIRNPLTPTYDVRTYQLANSLNFDQMKNVGEFMMKVSERFGKAAFPVGDESLRGYLERMTALLAERGETVKLNGDTRILRQLAFQGVKR